MAFRAYNQAIKSDFNLQLPLSNEKQDFDILQNPIAERKLANTNIFRKGITAKVNVEENSIILNWENIATFEAIGGTTLNYQRLTDDDNIFRLFTISEAFGLILQQKGYFLLHGSAVQVGKKAYVFIGISGAGKSTTIAAFAKAGYTVLSDDMTAISFDKNGKPIILPAYPEIKIWENSVNNLGFDKTKLEPAYEGHDKYLLKQPEDIFPSEGIPLEQIIVLQKPYSRKKEALKINEIPIELLKYYPLPQQILRGSVLERHFWDSIKIASQVSVKRVNRPKNYPQLFDFINTFQ